MNIYFIRHAATDLLKEGKAQFDDTPLSSLGLAQAEKLASRLETLHLDTIISSPHQRATDTADIIAKKLSLQTITSPLFAEIKKPLELHGLSKDDPTAKNIYSQINKNISNLDWHYSDEENFSDIKKRALLAIDYLSNLEGDNVAVITHANYLSLLLLFIADPDFSDPSFFVKWRSFCRITNTGITHLTFQDSKWHLRSWNDDSHALDL